MATDLDKFFAEVEELLEPIKQPGKYRLYYDDNGQVLFYTMDSPPGNYIEVTKEVFAKSPSNVVVRNGELKYVRTGAIYKYVPNLMGQFFTDIRDVTVIATGNYSRSWIRRDYDED